MRAGTEPSPTRLEAPVLFDGPSDHQSPDLRPPSRVTSATAARSKQNVPSPGGCSYVKSVSAGDQELPSPGGLVCRDGGVSSRRPQPGHGAVGRCQVNGMKRKQSARVQAASVTVPLDSTVRSKP